MKPKPLYSLGVMFLACLAVNVHADLSAPEILKKSREAYAALSSYQDEGSTTTVLNGHTAVGNFKARMARPGFYRIKLEPNPHSLIHDPRLSRGVEAWSAGKGNFLDLFGLTNEDAEARKNAPQASDAEINQIGRELTLTAFPNGGISQIFFKLFKNMQPFDMPSRGLRTEPDENVNNVVCYVLTADAIHGETKTLWIGKQDFLIRKFMSITPNDVFNANGANEAQAEVRQRIPGLPPMPEIKPQTTSDVEIHTNIVVNQKFSPSDFAR